MLKLVDGKKMRKKQQFDNIAERKAQRGHI